MSLTIIRMKDSELVDSLELDAGLELEVQIRRLPSGELVIRFSDCNREGPEIYLDCWERAKEWIAKGFAATQ